MSAADDASSGYTRRRFPTLSIASEPETPSASPTPAVGKK
jgi:hypothetical protein